MPLPLQCLNASEGDMICSEIYFGTRLLPPGTNLADIPPFDLANYPSSDARINNAISATMTKELDAGWLFVPARTPRWITPVYGKDESNSVRQKIRIITDFSKPDNGSINDFSPHQSFKMMQKEDTIALLRPHGFMAKVDLADAYRSVGILPAHWELCSVRALIRGKMTIITNTRLVFGLAQAAESFCRLTQAVRAMLAALGVPASVVYADDFWIIEGDQLACDRALEILLQLLKELGWSENDRKRITATQASVHCGILYETNVENQGILRVSVPPDKLQRAQVLASTLLQQRNITLRQLQSAIGIFAHLTATIWTGKTYLRRLIVALTDALAANHQQLTITAEMRQDFLFWQHVAHVRNGRAIILQPQPQQQGFLATDASEWGFGGYFNGRTFSIAWSDCHRAVRELPIDARSLFFRRFWPHQRQGNSFWFIAYRETFAAYYAWLRWGAFFRHQLVLHHTDNTVTLAAINFLSTASRQLMRMVRQMAEVQVAYNTRIEALYISTEQNYVADALSRGVPADIHLALERLALDPAPLRPPFQQRTFSNPAFLTHRARALRLQLGLDVQQTSTM